MTHTVTLDDIRRMLVRSAGEPDGVDLAGDIIDTDFDRLGYDSLALMETAAGLQREFGVRIPDDVATALRTPRELLEFVNSGNRVEVS